MSTENIIISRVSSKKEMKEFVRFNYELYKDNPYAVPDLLEDTLDTFNKKKNPAFRFCEAEWFLARRNGKIVKSLNVKCIIVGDDFRFGHNRAGDHRLLSAMAGAPRSGSSGWGKNAC